MDNLAMDCARAKALGYGCHYGWFKADYPNSSAIPVKEAGGDLYKTCAHCGERFIPSKKGVKYCGAICSYNANYERIKQRRAEHLATVNCPVCGKEFVSRYGMKYCSAECRIANAMAVRERSNNG